MSSSKTFIFPINYESERTYTEKIKKIGDPPKNRGLERVKWKNIDVFFSAREVYIYIYIYILV